MSIELITGVPGSGKTYFASDKMKKIYDSKSRLIYTNVNLKIEHNEYIKNLDVEELYDFAQKEYELFLKFKKLSKIYNDEKAKEEDEYNLSINNDVLTNDTKLITLDESENKEDFIFNENNVVPFIGNYDNYLKASGLLKNYGHSFIVWDECQNDLEENDPVWIRFFSYHRHFDMDIILITQDLSLIHRKYKSFVQKFFFGVNASKRFLSTTLRFKVYTDSREFKKYYIETISLKMTKEIHNFYDSGAYNVDKSMFVKFLTLPILLIIIVFLVYKFLFSKEETKIVSNDVNTTSLDSSTIDDLDSTDEDTDSFERSEEDHLIFFNCNLSTCTMKNSSFNIPLNKMNTFADAVGMDILYSSKINNYYSLVVVNVNSNLYSDLMGFNLSKKGEKHEKGEMDFNSPSVFSK